jgi:hypothetical protein
MKILLSILFLALTTFGQTTIRWQMGTAHSDSRFINGKEVKMIDADGVTVTATLIERKNWIPHAFVTVENETEARILVDPTDWTLNVLDKPRVLKSKEPDKLAKSLDSRGAWSAALSGISGAMATKQTTGTIRNSDGSSSTVTITEKDEAARARAEATGRRNQDTLESAAQYVRESSLRLNTLLPKESVYGIVWFENKGYKEVLLVIKIAGVIYEFPFTKKK